MQFHEHKPIYLQISDYILEKILKNELQAGDKVPSIRELAILAEVTPNTAMRAFQFLQEKEIIFNKRGIGYFVSPSAINEAKKLKLDEFANDLLPTIFKQMDNLDIDFDQLKIFYNNYKQKKDENKSK